MISATICALLSFAYIHNNMKIKIFILFVFFFTSLKNSWGQCCRCCRAGNELITNGDFNFGNVGFSTAYTFSNTAAPGRCGIVTNARTANPNNWASCTDHTSGSGKFIWYDLSNTSNTNMWTQRIDNLTPNANYVFSCWINTLDPHSPATIGFLINGQSVSSSFIAPGTLCNWVQKTFVWNAGSDSSALITITNLSTISEGNDIGIDDISFKKCSPISIIYPDVIICNGQNYTLPNGTIVNTPGTYIDTLPTADGCDSLRITTIKSAAQIVIKQQICEGQSYFGYNTTGVYIDSFKTVNGCDSIRKLQLAVNKKSFIAIKKTICEGQYFLGHSVSGIYLDTLRSVNDCDSVINTKLTVKFNCEPYFPNAFTPNGDKKNDTFKILNVDEIENYQLSIYNKWGSKVFDTENYLEGWDGKFKLILQPEGIYVWNSSFTLLGKYRQLKGTVILLR